MTIRSIFRSPGEGVALGVATAIGVVLIYKNALPTTADIREGTPFSQSAEAERKKAAWTSTALVAGVFLFTKDANSYIISGAVLALTDYAYKHANSVHPATQKPAVEAGGASIAPGMNEAAAVDPYSMPAY